MTIRFDKKFLFSRFIDHNHVHIVEPKIFYTLYSDMHSGILIAHASPSPLQNTDPTWVVVLALAMVVVLQELLVLFALLASPSAAPPPDHGATNSPAARQSARRACIRPLRARPQRVSTTRVWVEEAARRRRKRRRRIRRTHWLPQGSGKSSEHRLIAWPAVARDAHNGCRVGRAEFAGWSPGIGVFYSRIAVTSKTTCSDNQARGSGEEIG